MEEKDFKELGEKLNKEMGAEMEKFNQALKDSSEGTKKEATEAIEAIKGKLTENIEAQTKATEEIQTQLNDMNVAFKTLKETKTAGARKSLGNAIGELTKSDEFSEYIKNPGNQTSFTLDLKAGDMTTINSYTGDVIEGDRKPGFVTTPDQPIRVRQILPSGSTGSDKWRFIKETAYDDGMATRVEGATMGQTDFDLTEQSVDVENISTFLTITREMLDDTEGLQSYINMQLPSKYGLIEDNQLLNGDGVSPNLDGLVTNGQALVDVLSDADAGRWDIIAASATQLKVANFNPNWAIIHPTDRLKMILEKDGDGAYRFPSDMRNGGSLSVDGVAIFENSAITVDNFLVMDSMECQVLDREKLILEFWMQHASNATARAVTITANARLTLAIYNDTAFVTQDFTSALAAAQA